MPGGNPRGPPDRGECPACTSIDARPAGWSGSLAPRRPRRGLPMAATDTRSGSNMLLLEKKRAGFARVGVPGLDHRMPRGASAISPL